MGLVSIFNITKIPDIWHSFIIENEKQTENNRARSCVVSQRDPFL